MANALYTAAREQYLKGSAGALGWVDIPIKCVLVHHDAFVPDPNTHVFLSDIPAANRVVISPLFTGKTDIGGVADADDVAISNFTGNVVHSINIFHDTGTETTSRLIAYIDTATGLPFTPNGGPVEIRWDNGPNKIFKL